MVPIDTQINWCYKSQAISRLSKKWPPQKRKTFRPTPTQSMWKFRGLAKESIAPHRYGEGHLVSSRQNDHVCRAWEKNPTVPTNGTNPSGDRLKMNKISPYSATNSSFFACWAKGFKHNLPRHSSAHCFIHMPVCKTKKCVCNPPALYHMWTMWQTNASSLFP